MPTKWLGSSTITLICRSTNGTLHNKERDSLLPVFVNITDGKCGGNRGALDIPVSPHSVVIADRGYCDFSGQRRSSVAGLTEDDRQTVDKERQVGDPMQLRTEVLNL